MAGISVKQAEESLRLKRHKLRIDTPGGKMETVIDDPGESRQGLLLVAHPHPLQGGSMDNKVVHTVARVATDHGHVAVRPNFRGVGMSEGEYDEGIGETEDMLAIIEFVSSNYPGLPWCLAGFSFGAFVQHRVAWRIRTKCVLLVAPPVNLYPFDAPVPGTAVIHGDMDEVVPYPEALAWASRHNVPLRVIQGSGHFFHGRLNDLKQAIEELCPW
ncbi:MAG: CocE/NonD family hydrolase [Pseudomonadota bacterium]